MIATPLDAEVDRIAASLARSTPKQVAAFSAACAERMIDLYREFSTKECWGDFALLRRTLDDVWLHFAGGVPDDRFDGAEALISAVTPGDDRFPSIECLFAQNACICVDSAVQWCLARERAHPGGHGNASQYALETVRAAVSMSQTGYMDPGDDARGVAFETALLNDPRMQRELSLQREDLADATSAINEVSVGRIKQRAKRNRWTVAALLTVRAS